MFLLQTVLESNQTLTDVFKNDKMQNVKCEFLRKKLEIMELITCF